MTINEAKALLNDIIVYEHSAVKTPKGDAIKLGYQALRAVQDARANNYYTPIATMPGETK